MRSIPLDGTRINAPTVWRDALGPGYAVGAAQGLLMVAREAAVRPYRVGR